MSMYDPGWHRFEPTREEVLVDVAAEERASHEGRGVRRLLRLLPWPVRVVVPFVVALAAPLAGLAVVFGAFGDTRPVPPGGLPSMNLDVTIVARAGSPLAIEPSRILFGLGPDATTSREVQVTNLSDERAVTIALSSPDWPAEFRVLLDRYAPIPPGATVGVRILVGRRSVLFGGDYKATMVISGQEMP